MKLEKSERWALFLTAVFLLFTGGTAVLRHLDRPDFSVETARSRASPAAMETVPVQGGGPAEEEGAPLVNINTADVKELQSLNGIGEKLAGRIVEWRMMFGPFAQVEDLMQVQGIGEKILEKNRERLTVGEGGQR